MFGREISGFPLCALKAFALLGCYVACVRSCLPKVWDCLWGLSCLGPYRLSRNVGKPLWFFICICVIFINIVFIIYIVYFLSAHPSVYHFCFVNKGTISWDVVPLGMYLRSYVPKFRGNWSVLKLARTHTHKRTIFFIMISHCVPETPNLLHQILNIQYKSKEKCLYTKIYNFSAYRQMAPLFEIRMTIFKYAIQCVSPYGRLLSANTSELLWSIAGGDVFVHFSLRSLCSTCASHRPSFNYFRSFLSWKTNIFGER